MLKPEDNELLCRVGPGTPMGELFRRFWIPAMVPGELPGPDCDPVRLRLLGEDLVAFRDSDGRIGVLEERCPHRRASLFYGLNEGCGLRCVYHGWKFDVDGACVDMPNERPDSDFKHKVRAKAYAAAEWGGYIWVYMGPADRKPPLPEFEWAMLPPTHRWQKKWLYNANYMQGLEGELDTCHTTFLHRLADTSTLSPGLAEAHDNWQQDGMPRLDVRDTDYGYYYSSQRDMQGGALNSGDFNWRVTQWVLPSNSIIPQPQFPISSRAYIPVDDEHTFVFGTSFNPDAPMTQKDIDFLETGLGAAPRTLPGTFIPETNKSNEFMMDRDAQRRGSATGMPGVNNQDRAIVESMGPIVDRENEYLGTSDVAVIAARRILLQLAKDLADGKEPDLPHSPALFGVRPIDVMSPLPDLDGVVSAYSDKLRLPS
ncbi:MAG: Rieske 2Fe-2S domain-containing protein [Rhodospirillaceae bacterium]|jgi:phthalate 4,5-dioxygenase|nr:Rieske 2Fe-2S domain-containing protein [Rhodospirillaceae bacterium]MBT5667586.1 Rieske 2Fe-2S domain-containing protein [Rhodospirillaceae bacterium]MBT5809666.1 Rieske 2Fe-2S domain-containing protein [Rhodospirillaceae bacterium]